MPACYLQLKKPPANLSSAFTERNVGVTVHMITWLNKRAEMLRMLSSAHIVLRHHTKPLFRITIMGQKSKFILTTLCELLDIKLELSLILWLVHKCFKTRWELLGLYTHYKSLQFVLNQKQMSLISSPYI